MRLSSRGPRPRRTGHPLRSLGKFAYKLVRYPITTLYEAGELPGSGFVAGSARFKEGPDLSSEREELEPHHAPVLGGRGVQGLHSPGFEVQTGSEASLSLVMSTASPTISRLSIRPNRMKLYLGHPLLGPPLTVGGQELYLRIMLLLPALSARQYLESKPS